MFAAVFQSENEQRAVLSDKAMPCFALPEISCTGWVTSISIIINNLLCFFM